MRCFFCLFDPIKEDDFGYKNYFGFGQNLAEICLIFMSFGENTKILLAYSPTTFKFVNAYSEMISYNIFEIHYNLCVGLRTFWVFSEYD